MLATRFAYGRKAVIRANHGFLSEDQLRSIVPSIFAEEAHESRSERYAYVPTIEVVRGLADEGFRPTFACQAIPRDKGRIGTTKHMLRFRREVDADRTGEVPEVIGINSHGGETSFQLIGGVFRFVCENGMVTGNKYDEVRVRHTGNIVDEVIDGAARVVASFDPIMGAVERMKGITLRASDAAALAEAALTVRYDLEAGERAPITAADLLRPRRTEDTGADLWSTFNRLQENVIRGGIRGRAVNANNQVRRMTTREVAGIDQNVSLNRALWTLAERVADLKAA
jgi:hypothetical protein